MHPLSSLSKPLRLGAFALSHRIVLPAFTISGAAHAGSNPTAEKVRHYAQRATPGGLLVTEATYVSAVGHLHPGRPGLYTPAQVNRWRDVTAAVHARGGILLAQLSYGVGAGTHGAHLDAALDAYRATAENAGDAGFDGVELHAAHGSLAALAARGGESGFLADLVETVCAIWGGPRVGLCLDGLQSSPGDQPPRLRQALQAVQTSQLAYVHLAGLWPAPDDASQSAASLEHLRAARAVIRGGLVLSGGFSGGHAATVLDQQLADAIGFGRAFLADPDLPARLLTHDSQGDFSGSPLPS